MTPPTVQMHVPGVPLPRNDAERFTQDMARSAVVQRHATTIDVNPDAGGSIPPWGVELMNGLRAMQIELAALKQCLFVGVRLAPDDFNAARVHIVDAFERQFHEMVQQLGRNHAQRPQHLAPADPANPRRSPS